ncbi:MAG: sulfite exporter TauE/SafE family protein [Rhodospirillaceae bacterium]|nr:sulfite exporter TauE/SafE family protein [Rhodospirillaceae bacterium]
MQVYLPIAEVSVDAFVLLGLGALVGFLGGMFGVGGGFLMTPTLILIGIPPAVAVASGANQIVASSISGAVSQWRRGNVDVRMGLVMLLSGMLGTVAGVTLFRLLQKAGQIDIVVQLSYVMLLGVVGTMMAVESTRTLLRRRGPARPPGRLHQHFWVHRWPLRMRFRRSKLYISAIPPMGIGFVVGVLTAIMGIGGGFIMVPAMIYLFGMPTLTVVGTSQFQIVFVTGMTTLLLAATTHTVDVVLAILLIIGGVVGSQIGTRASQLLRGEYLRGLLAFLVLSMALKLAYDLLAPPSDLFSIAIGR